MDATQQPGQTDILVGTIARSLTGFAMAKAILEDYAEVIARLDNIDPEQIKERVKKRTDEIFKEIKQNMLNQPTEEKA